MSPRTKAKSVSYIKKCGIDGSESQLVYSVVHVLESGNVILALWCYPNKIINFHL